jgi:gliding motility-associated-like protein
MVADTLGLPLTYHWNFGTGQPADTANTANAGFDYHNPGKYFASLQILSPIGCWVQAIDTVLAIAPIRLKYVSDTGICRGNSIDFRLTGADTYTWFPDSSLSDIQGGSAIARPDSTTTYRVVGKDKYGCFADTATMTVSVASLPTVTVDPEISIPGGMQATLASLASADVISWNWTPPYFLSCLDCASPTTSPQAPISYTVTVTNANGCTASATVAVRLTCTENTIHIPNAFTPNHDGNNDLFYPVGTGVKIIRYFQVFSRWGQLLYSQKDIPANDKSFGWDGTFNGVPQPAGTYVYMAGIECFTGETYSLKGTVELLR